MADSTPGSVNAGTRNPFRYREYCWDDETGFYYIDSRYYDPETGRFINADDPALIMNGPTGITDKNLYAYCDNNPITRKDEGGQFWNIVIGAGVGAAAGLIGQIVSDVVTSVISDKATVSNWQTYVGAIAGGAAGGAVLGATGNVNLSNAVTGAATTGVGQSLEKCTIKGYDKSWGEIGANTVADSAVSFGLGKIPGIKGKTKGKNSWSAVYKGGLTRIRNNTAKNMSKKVIKKGIGANAIGGAGLDVYYGFKQYYYSRVKRGKYRYRSTKAARRARRR